jgi:hypothetical protein
MDKTRAQKNNIIHYAFSHNETTHEIIFQDLTTSTRLEVTLDVKLHLLKALNYSLIATVERFKKRGKK